MTKNLARRLEAMENFLYCTSLASHEKVRGGWCIDSCAACLNIQ